MTRRDMDSLEEVGFKYPDELKKKGIPENLAVIFQAIYTNLGQENRQKFNALKTNEDRIAFLLRQNIIHQVLQLEPEFEGKSAEKALACKQEGNEYFKKKLHLAALDKYTQSILFAPQGEAGDLSVNNGNNAIGETLSEKPIEEGHHISNKANLEDKIGNIKISSDDNHETKNGNAKDESATTKKSDENIIATAFSNRSATLLHLGKFELCLGDIDQALKHGFPKQSEYKLLDRKGKCYLALKKKLEALDSLQNALLSLEHSNLDENGLDLWRKTIEKQLGNCSLLNVEESGSASKGFSIPTISNDVNGKHKNASNLLDFQFNEKRGRHAIAASDIRISSVLISEEPYTSVIYPAFYKSHCQHCIRRCLAPLPCKQCASVVYCTDKCREESLSSRHQYECNVLGLLNQQWCGRNGHLALRLVTMRGYHETLEFNKHGFVAAEHQLESVPSVFSLMTNEGKRSVEDMLDVAVIGLYLAKVLQQSGYFRDDIKNLEVLNEETTGNESNTKALANTACLLMKYWQIVQCNALAITELQTPDYFDDPKPEDIGLAIYPTAALVNHSCDPSCDLTFYGHKLIVRALKNISKGQEVCISYGPLFFQKIRDDRKNKLCMEYFFDCRCSACYDKIRPWQMLECEVPTFRCSNCSGPLSYGDMVKMQYIKCDKCSHRQDVQIYLEQLQQAHEGFQVALTEAKGGQLDSAIGKLESYMALMQICLLHPWRDLVSCQEALKYCYRLQANKKTV